MKQRFLSIVMTLIIIICSFSVKPIDAKVKIKLNKKSVSIVKGKKYKLKVKGTKRKVKWSSKNKKIATVSKKGYVKAKKVGTTYVYAKIGKKKLKCKVKVKNPPFCKIYDIDVDSESFSCTIKNLSKSNIIIDNEASVDDGIDDGYMWADTDSTTTIIKPVKKKDLFFYAFDQDPIESYPDYNCTWYIKRNLDISIDLKYKNNYYSYFYFSDTKSGSLIKCNFLKDFFPE